MVNNEFYNREITEVLAILHSREAGLTDEEAQIKLKEFGLNKLTEAKTESLLAIFFRQFQSPLIYVLLVAAVITYFLGRLSDSLIIIFVLIFNSSLGAFHEGRAQKTLNALKKLTETKALVLRDGKEMVIADTDLVPGDIIFLEEGEKVPADGRIIIAHNLIVDEASITGESGPVYKIVDKLRKQNLSVPDQKNMIFKGTYALSGNGMAVITKTGVRTFIGKISEEVASIDTDIPLKKDISNLSRLIVKIVFGISTILFFIGLMFGKSVSEMFATVVTLAVSIIPEGLPIILTVVLASGVWRMSKRNALVKKLQAVEALGQTRVLAVDKTGTITKNQLTVRKFFSGGKIFNVTGIGYEPKGDVIFNEKVVEPLNHEEVILAGKIASMCANARVMELNDGKDMWKVTGDPTEAALMILGAKIGFHKSELETEFPQLDEVPFNHETKYHIVSHKIDDEEFITVVGAPEAVLLLSSKIVFENKEENLDYLKKQELETIFHSFSREGLRVLAFAYIKKPLSQKKTAGFVDINNLVFAGFYGLEDSLNAGVSDAIGEAKRAGMKIIMMTGDHKITAEAIAKEAGIYEKGDLVLTGEELQAMSEEELELKISMVTVFARVTPDQKLKIIQAYRKRGEKIAMTGDGVNDAPSLVAADLGIAMGKIGTEVAKEAADIILLDDNFKSIVAAIEEGRNIYKAIKRVVLYLFSTGVGEALTITAALFAGWPLPVLPAQIIWLNLVTDSFLDVGLGMEQKEKGLLDKSFEKPKRYLVDKSGFFRIFLMALTMMGGAIFVFGKLYQGDLNKALTMSMTTLAIFQWFNAWNCRSENKSIFQINPFSNKFLLAGTLIVITLQLFAIYNPILQKILHTTNLSLADWLFAISVSFSIVIVEECRKFIWRMKH